MVKVRIILIGLLISTSSVVVGQQRGAITQFMFNGLMLNPAYAGSHDALSLAAMSRHQWVGLEGAPTTQTVSLHAPLRKNHIAVGGWVFNDKIGVTSQVGAFGVGAYKIDHKNYHISFGMQIGMVNYSSNMGSIELRDPDDLDFYDNSTNEFQPNFGAGVYYYRSNMYIGISAPELMRNSYGDLKSESGGRQIRHYYLMTGFVHPLSHSVKIKPNALVKYADNAPVSLDLNLSFLFNDVIWTGVSWRSFDSIDLILEAQVTNNLRFGYAFDITTTDLGLTNSGTHEVVLNYRFRRHIDRMIKPKFF